jgi:hypothetical protein
MQSVETAAGNFAKVKADVNDDGVLETDSIAAPSDDVPVVGVALSPSPISRFGSECVRWLATPLTLLR